MKRNKEDTIRRKRIKKVAKEMAALCEKQQEYFAGKMQQCEYVRNIFRDVFEKISNVSDDPQLEAIEKTLLRIQNALQAQDSEIERQVMKASSSVSVLASSINTAAAIVGVEACAGTIPDLSEQPEKQSPDHSGIDKETGIEVIKKRLLSVNETAELLGVSTRLIYDSVSRKRKSKFPIKHKRIGRLVKFNIQDIEKYLES